MEFAPSWWGHALTLFHNMLHRWPPSTKPAIAQLVEHLTVDCCRYQMVPGSIPGGQIFALTRRAGKRMSKRGLLGTVRSDLVQQKNVCVRKWWCRILKNGTKRLRWEMVVPNLKNNEKQRRCIHVKSSVFGNETQHLHFLLTKKSHGRSVGRSRSRSRSRQNTVVARVNGDLRSQQPFSG